MINFHSKTISYHLFFITIILIIFFLKLSNYDYVFFTDQDHVHVYEALVFNSGKKQTYFDHPGLICFILLGIWFRILDFFQLINFSNLYYSEYKVEDLNQLIFYTRIFNLLIILSIYYFLDKIISFFIKDKKICFFIITIILFSSAFYGLMVRVRTEIFSILFFLLFFQNQINYQKSKNFIYLFLSGIFLFIALSSKVQIIILITVSFLLIRLLTIEINYTKLKINKITYLVFSIFFVIGLNIHISILYNLDFFYDRTFGLISYIYFPLMLISLSLPLIKLDQYTNYKTTFLSVSLNFFVITSGAYLALLFYTFLPYTDFESIFVTLTPIEKLFSFSGGTNSLNRIFSISIFSDAYFILKTLELPEYILIFFGLCTIFYRFKKNELIKFILLFLIYFFVKLLLTLRYGQYIPSYYLMYGYLVFVFFMIFVSQLFKTNHKFLFVVLIISTFFALINFITYTYQNIDKERSTLDFCTYKNEIDFANYFSNYYCN